MKIPSTKVYAQDLTQGFFILSDLGPSTLFDHNLDTSKQTNREELYTQAINILVLIQKNGNAFLDQLPLYDLELLETEMNLFLDWYCIKELEMNTSQLNKFNLEECFKHLSESALKQTQVFVHRD